MAMTTQTHKLPGCLLDVQWMHHVQSKLEQQKSAYVFFWLACGPFLFWFLFPARTCVSCWRSGWWNPGVDGCCALKVAPRLEEFDGSRSVAALLEEAALEESIPREVLREKFRNYDIILYIHMIIIYCEHMFFGAVVLVVVSSCVHHATPHDPWKACDTTEDAAGDELGVLTCGRSGCLGGPYPMSTFGGWSLSLAVRCLHMVIFNEILW